MWTYLDASDPTAVVTGSPCNPLLFLRIETADGNAVQVNLHWSTQASLDFLDELTRQADLLRSRILARPDGASWLTATETPDQDHGVKPSRKSGAPMPAAIPAGRQR